jgi:hypothetical protein
MRHARADDLDVLEPLLERLRAIDGLREPKRGKFDCGRRLGMHFHQDPAGFFADIRIDAVSSRHRVTTKREQETFARFVRRGVASVAR